MPLGAARFGLSGADLGKLELIETQTYSSAVSFVDFTSIDESTYNVHFVTTNNLKPTTDTNFNLNFYESGVLETASVYQWARQYNQNNGGNGTQNSTAVAGIQLCNTLGSATNETGQGYVYIYNAGDSSKYTFCTFQDVVLDNNGIFTQTFGSAVLPQASTVDGFRFSLVSGNFSSFDISLYGIKE
jgi:hypothetical protein